MLRVVEGERRGGRGICTPPFRTTRWLHHTALGMEQCIDGRAPWSLERLGRWVTGGGMEGKGAVERGETLRRWLSW